MPVYLPRGALYSYGITTVRIFGDNFIKLTTTNVSRNAGVETKNDEFDYFYEVSPFPDEEGKLCKIYSSAVCQREIDRQQRNYSTNYKKSLSSLYRTKRTIFDYAYSNKFDYFATFTIDPARHDSFDLSSYHKKFSQFVRDNFRDDENNLQYLCVPERHASGAWHEHALLKGLAVDNLRLFSADERLPVNIRKKILSGFAVYDFPAYHDAFGFCTLEPVRSSSACASYIAKYITKSFDDDVLGRYCAKSYYVSRDLNKSVLIKRGFMRSSYCVDYQDDRYKTATFAYSDEFLQTVLAKFCD